MFTNIERFYKDNHYKLLENREQNSLRPGKSFAKDPITCIEKFVNFAKDHSENIINDSQLAQILGQLEANTKSQNLRTMREFGFLEEISDLPGVSEVLSLLRLEPLYLFLYDLLGLLSQFILIFIALKFEYLLEFIHRVVREFKVFAE